MVVDVDTAIYSITLAGSVISLLATTLVLISFAIYRHHLQNFRHMLILELMIFGRQYVMLLCHTSPLILPHYQSSRTA